jgi:hypothetical protein
MVRNELPSKIRTRMSRTVIAVAIAAAPIVAAAGPALAEPAVAPAQSQEVRLSRVVQPVDRWLRVWLRLRLFAVLERQRRLSRYQTARSQPARGLPS